MTRIFSFLLFAIVSINLSIAQKYFTKTGTTQFIGSVDTFEPIEAKNESTTAILNEENGEFASLLFINAFHFKVALMEEHFNENYMETDKFPKAVFKGYFEQFDKNKFSSTEKDIRLKGTLTIKGIDKDISTLAKISIKDNTYVITGSFDVSPSDFNIEIPKLVEYKIAKEIVISFNYELVPKQ